MGHYDYFTSAVRPTESAQHLLVRLSAECVVCIADDLVSFTQTQTKFAEWAGLNKAQVHPLFRTSNKDRFSFFFQGVTAAKNLEQNKPDKTI